jgi:hypothetical protein
VRFLIVFPLHPDFMGKGPFTGSPILPVHCLFLWSGGKLMAFMISGDYLGKDCSEPEYEKHQ